MVFCVNCDSEFADILKFCPTCCATLPTTDKEKDNQDHKQSKRTYTDLKNRVEKYKPMWDKYDVVYLEVNT